MIAFISLDERGTKRACEGSRKGPTLKTRLVRRRRLFANIERVPVPLSSRVTSWCASRIHLYRWAYRVYRKDLRPTMWSMWDVWYLTGCASYRSEHRSEHGTPSSRTSSHPLPPRTVNGHVVESIIEWPSFVSSSVFRLLARTYTSAARIYVRINERRV